MITILVADKLKENFSTKQELFEYAVMPFGPTNTPASFEKMMYTIDKDIERYIWYLDNILIYGSNTEGDHRAIVEKVLQQCIEYGPAVNLLKSKFDIPETIFLVHLTVIVLM